MHELSIALSIIDMVEEEAHQRGDAKVAAIHLRLGPLSGVVKEALVSAFGLAREGTELAECELKVEDVPLVAYCPACAAEQEIPSAQYLCCPVCDTPTPEVISGREMEVAAMEVCA